MLNAELAMLTAMQLLPPNTSAAWLCTACVVWLCQTSLSVLDTAGQDLEFQPTWAVPEICHERMHEDVH